jgi:hypothetical protein
MNINTLPDELRTQAELLLTEGASFGETADAIKGLGAQVNADDVAAHFRSSRPLQRARVQWQLDAARQLKEILMNPPPGQMEYADAVLLGALRGALARTEGSAPAEPKQTKAQRENVKLTHRAMMLSEHAIDLEREVCEARLHVERERQSAATEHMLQLLELVHSPEYGAPPGSELVRKLQAVYGLISRDLSGGPSEQQAIEGGSRQKGTH